MDDLIGRSGTQKIKMERPKVYTTFIIIGRGGGKLGSESDD